MLGRRLRVLCIEAAVCVLPKKNTKFGGPSSVHTVHRHKRAPGNEYSGRLEPFHPLVKTEIWCIKGLDMFIANETLEDCRLNFLYCSNGINGGRRD